LSKDSRDTVLILYIWGVKKEWYFRTLITVLALLLVMQQQTVVPNQEIVVAFDHSEVTSQEVQNAISIVKKQLESIGVKNTKISEELHNGTLKIAYYSDADVESIKKIFSSNKSVVLDHVFYDQQNKRGNKFPLDSDVTDFRLDVYEIQKASDIDTDFNGIYVLEIKQKQDRSYESDVSNFAIETYPNHLDKLLKVTQKVHRYIAISIDHISYKIPEVRAGPLS